MSTTTSSGIQTAADGHSFIPSSKRADGSTRKAIRVRPGYRPPEDVERYKSKNAENWRTRGGGGVPGADTPLPAAQQEADPKSKNAKRREAARRKKQQEEEEDGAQTRAADEIDSAVAKLQVQDDDFPTAEPALDDVRDDDAGNADVERQKKIRNNLKKLRAIRELKAKKAAGEKLSADQLVKIAKEQEIVRDLVKLDYDGPEIGEDLEPGLAESRPD